MTPNSRIKCGMIRPLLRFFAPKCSKAAAQNAPYCSYKAALLFCCCFINFYLRILDNWSDFHWLRLWFCFFVFVEYSLIHASRWCPEFTLELHSSSFLGNQQYLPYFSIQSWFQKTSGLIQKNNPLFAVGWWRLTDTVSATVVSSHSSRLTTNTSLKTSRTRQDRTNTKKPE